MVPLFIEYIQAIPLHTINGITALQNLFSKKFSLLYLFGYSNSVAPESIKNIGTAQYLIQLQSNFASKQKSHQIDVLSSYNASLQHKNLLHYLRNHNKVLSPSFTSFYLFCFTFAKNIGNLFLTM